MRNHKLTSLLCLTGLFLCLAPKSYGNFVAGQQHFKRRDYESAAASFYFAYKAANNKQTRVKAEWRLAQSLHKLGLLYSASKYYSVIVRRGRVKGNPNFRRALEGLGLINAKVNLGQSHIVQLFKGKGGRSIGAADVPGPARGFYFYYQGIKAFKEKKYDVARGLFAKVPGQSSYKLGAIFHEGVISNLSGRHSASISLLENALARAGYSDEEQVIREMALLNIARVHYETKRYAQAISYYGRIPRDSEFWLDALWEASWAFFFMQKFNNALGNIHTLHSPFFINRFFPESYILQAITFLRLCHYREVKASMSRFNKRYSPVFGDIKALLKRFEGEPAAFYRFVYNYKFGNLRRFRRAEEIVKKLSLQDSFRMARETVRFSSREEQVLRQYRSAWRKSGLIAELNDFLGKKKQLAIRNSGNLMYRQAVTYYKYLRDLSEQTKLVVAEMQLGKIETLRNKLNVGNKPSKLNFIGGLKELKIRESLEYWPFEQEYWEDELGFYVYNLASKCTVSEK